MSRIRKNPKLTAQRLREVLDYDPWTGVFRWKINPARTKLAGKVAGCITSDGYLTIQVDGEVHTGGRLAFLYLQGEWPLHQIDHRDLNKANNVWNNLRPATRSQNCRNAPGRSKCGIKNLHRLKSGKGWQVCIAGAPRKTFQCLGQALCYRNCILRAIHGPFAQTRMRQSFGSSERRTAT